MTWRIQSLALRNERASGNTNEAHPPGCARSRCSVCEPLQEVAAALPPEPDLRSLAFSEDEVVRPAHPPFALPHEHRVRWEDIQPAVVHREVDLVGVRSASRRGTPPN